ncbi:futalosine hydrolase [Desulfuribacillus stibiiarsenatis]|uniref:futalosine hydrolase n=1 Tax=Desulfuribacillus stibiiarsenatis TaxID=1390249 RepID=UPI0009F4E1BE|nr:futalosine hydrolase [Desulfuribacillus stibiiarsenatis]
MQILIVTSVEPEKQAIINGLDGDTRFTVIAAGVGPVASAANTMKALTGKSYDLVLNLGIGGGFVGKAEVCSVVVADTIIAADLGAETAEGFRNLEQLQLGKSEITCDLTLGRRILTALQSHGIPTYHGTVLTLSTVTGTAETTEELLKRFPNAVAEAMEGYGVAYSANQLRIPVVEIRSISNAIGPRDRSSWKIKEALARLKDVSAVLSEVL